MGEVCDHGYPHFVVWAELTELQRREVVEGVYCPERDGVIEDTGREAQSYHKA